MSLRISVALERFWQARHQLEGRTWLERVLESSAGTDGERSRAATAAGTLAYLSGDHTPALGLYREAIDRASRAGDVEAHARALGLRAWVLAELGYHAQAMATVRECQHLAEHLTDPWTRAETLGLVPNTLTISGSPQEADALYREHLALRRELGAELRVCGILNSLGFAALLRGDDDDARIFLEGSLDLARAMSDPLRLALALDNRGFVAVFHIVTTRRSRDSPRRFSSAACAGIAAAEARSFSDYPPRTPQLGNLELAAKLDAISTSLFGATGIVMPALELQRLEPRLRKARELATPWATGGFIDRAKRRPLETALVELDRAACDS